LATGATAAVGATAAAAGATAAAGAAFAIGAVASAATAEKETAANTAAIRVESNFIGRTPVFYERVK
jgi:hypothetical protein